MVIYKHKIVNESVVPAGCPDTDAIINNTYSQFQKYIPTGWTKWVATVLVNEPAPNKRRIGVEITATDANGNPVTIPAPNVPAKEYMDASSKYIAFIQGIYSALSKPNCFSKMIITFCNNNGAVGSNCDFEYPAAATAAAPCQEATLTESKKLIGYHGTKSIEKKYDIPDKYCIEWKELNVAKNGPKMLTDKINGALKSITDENDVNNYFIAILERLFYRNQITNSTALAKYPDINKLYNLYTQSYKGELAITKTDLYNYAAERIKKNQRTALIMTGLAQPTVAF